jgi:hypothetical protein
MKNHNEMRDLGVRLGLIFGVVLLSLAYLSMLLGVGAPVIALLATLYKGYAATLLGGLIGFILGFVHGYVVGVLVIIFSVDLSNYNTARLL